MKFSSPFEVMRDVILRDPAASTKDIQEKTFAIIGNDKELSRAVYDYWFGNVFRSVKVIVNKHSVAVQKKTRKARAEGKRTRHAVTAKLQMALMDHMLSNGKLLRFATFGECAKEGGWLATLAKCGKPTQLVGNVLTEPDLWNLRQRNAA